MSDYEAALKAWQSGHNPPGEGGGMPEAFRIRPAFKANPARVVAVERIQAWTRARFALPEEGAVMVAEVTCGLPGCPPLETAVAFWTATDRRHQFKVFKALEDVIEDDLPPAFMKDALLVDEEAGLTCC